MFIIKKGFTKTCDAIGTQAIGESLRKERPKTGVHRFIQTPTLKYPIVSTDKRHFTARTNFFHNGIILF